MVDHSKSELTGLVFNLLKNFSNSLALRHYPIPFIVYELFYIYIVVPKKFLKNS